MVRGKTCAGPSADTNVKDAAFARDCFVLLGPSVGNYDIDCSIGISIDFRFKESINRSFDSLPCVKGKLDHIIAPSGQPYRNRSISHVSNVRGRRAATKAELRVIITCVY